MLREELALAESYVSLKVKALCMPEKLLWGRQIPYSKPWVDKVKYLDGIGQ